MNLAVVVHSKTTKALTEFCRFEGALLIPEYFEDLLKEPDNLVEIKTLEEALKDPELPYKNAHRWVAARWRLVGTGCP